MKFFIFLLFTLIVLTSFSSKQNSLQSDSLQVVWYSQYRKNKVPKYHKVELGFSMPLNINKKIENFFQEKKNEVLNPFDPKDIDVEAVFISPSGKTKNIFAFYYIPIKKKENENKWTQDTTLNHWRVRFSPDEIGSWTYQIRYSNTMNKGVSKKGNFVCIKSDHKGRLKIVKQKDKVNRFLEFEESKESFFAIGGNLSHSSYGKLKPNQVKIHKKWINQLSENGGNFCKFELGAQNALPSWTKYNDYTSKMGEMWEYDKIIDLAEQKNIYFMIFRHHVEIEVDSEKPSWNGISWNENPYKIAFDLKQRKDYFINKKAIEWQKNELRYIVSRWGYSPNFVFYGYAEIDNWLKKTINNEGFDKKQALTLMKNWFVDQKEYVREKLKNNNLLFFVAYSSYLSTPENSKKFKGLFHEADLIGIHQYGETKQINYTNCFNKIKGLYSRFNKPYLFAEMGLNSSRLALYSATGVHFHNSIWSTSFMGGIGTGMNWWWDRGVHDFNYYKDYKAIYLFFKNQKLNTWNYKPQKWADYKNISKARIENFALVSQNKEKSIGWVHNATHYWRNYYDSIPEIKELVDSGYLTKPYTMEDGWVLQAKKVKNEFNFKIFQDHYGKPIVLSKNAFFKISGMKSSFLKKKKPSYRVVFYSTQINTNGQPVETFVIQSNWLGKLKIELPEKHNRKSDYAYQISYLGQN